MAPPAEPETTAEQLRTDLAGMLGSERVLAGEADRGYYSCDIYGGNRRAALVIRPESAEALATAVGAATEAGYSVIGRGGGTSYTGGYVPDREQSVIVDTTDLDRIVEINREDMYVTVESGVTWEALHRALRDTDLRTPYWGPLSGAVATVGGALSQNSILWGSGTTLSCSNAK